MTSGEASGGWGPSGEAAGGLLVRPRGCTFHRESLRACSVRDFLFFFSFLVYFRD